MSGHRETIPDGARILQASGKRNSGNILLTFGEGPERTVLKLYRCRRSRSREALRSFSQLALEQKRGASAATRYRTEGDVLPVWMREGFAVVEPLDRPLPADIAPPARWFAFCSAPRLDQVVSDKQEPLAYKQERMQKLGAAMQRRYRRALDLGEPLLVHEHGNINHVFVDGEELRTFDFENAFRPSVNLSEALAQETAGVLRSIRKFAGPDSEALTASWVEGFQDRELLRRIAHHAVADPGLSRRLKRWHDRRKRGAMSKTGIMEDLWQRLEGAP